MANFLIKSITTRKANTTLSTITKLSSESKRNPSTSWLLRNPRKGLGKFNWPLFALIVEMQFCFEGKLEAYPSYGFSVHKDPLWMQCFSYIMLLCSCQYSKCHFVCVKVKIMKTTVWLCEGISRRRRLLSVWIARGKYSNCIYFSRLEYLMLKKNRKPKSSLLPFLRMYLDNFEVLSETLSQLNSTTATCKPTVWPALRDTFLTRRVTTTFRSGIEFI